MFDDQRLHKVETDAGADDTGRCLGPEKPFTNAGKVLFIDADAVIVYRDYDLVSLYARL